MTYFTESVQVVLLRRLSQPSFKGHGTIAPELVYSLTDKARAVTAEHSWSCMLIADNKSSADGFTEELIRNKYTPHVSDFGLTMNLFEALIGKLRQQGKLWFVWSHLTHADARRILGIRASYVAMAAMDFCWCKLEGWGRALHLNHGEV